MTGLEELHGKRVLLVYAHCDDELVCGWPVLQDPLIEKCLIIASSDLTNQGRSAFKHRRWVTLDLCKSLGIEASVLDHDSDFYRLGHRDGSLASFENELLREIGKYRFDYVMTHNSYGEYGHMDHRFLSNLLYRTLEAPILTTDLVMASDWTDTPPRPCRASYLAPGELVGEAALDPNFYLKVQRYYEARGVWTWSTPPNAVAKVYRT